MVYKDQCTILSGILPDPYSGESIDFVRGVGTSNAVQIDHVVALSNAWQTGAFKLTLEKRTAFANDPLNLLAVKGVLNSQKVMAMQQRGCHPRRVIAVPMLHARWQ